MKFSKSIITLLAVAVAVLCSSCQTIEHRQSEWYFKKSDLPADKSVQWGSLDNGLRYAIMPNSEPPERVSLRLLVEAGSMHETQDQRGLAHFLEHMAFNGTENYKPGEMVEYFQRLGMGFGADTNAHTGFDETVYKLELPNGDMDMLEEGLRLFRDYADGMLLLEKEIEKEKGVILAEKRDRDSVRYRTYLADIEFNLPDSIIHDRFPIGVEETITGATKERFKAYYDKWYTADRMTVVAVGNVKSEDIIPLVEKYFKSLRSSNPSEPEPSLGDIKPSGLVAKLHTEAEAPATTVAIQTNARHFAELDSKAVRRKTLLRSMASSMLSRRFQILSKKEGAAFSEGVAYMYDAFDFVLAAGVELTCKKEQWAEALKTAEQEVRKAFVYGFVDTELDEAKANMLNGLELAVKGAATRKSKGLAAQLTSSVSDQEVFMSPEQQLELYKPMLEEVTVEECHNELKSFWDTKDINVFVSGNLSLDNASSEIKKVYQESLKTEITPPEEGEALEWTYVDFGEAGEVVERNVIEDLDVIQLKFDNNVRLNLKKTDFAKNSIRITIRIGGGKLEAFGQEEGIAMFTDSVFTAGGLEDYSVDDLQRLFAGKTVSCSMTVADDAFVFTGGTTPEDLNLQLQYMTSCITKPGYRDEALRQFKKSVEKLYVSLDHTIQGVMGNKVARFLAGGDLRFGYPLKEDILQFELIEAQQWLEEPLAKHYMEVSIVGDIDVRETIAAVAKTLAALPARDDKKKDYSEARKLNFPKDKANVSFSYETEIPKGIAAVYFPTEDGWDISRARRLNMLSEVFSDRLRIKVREDLGEAYSPFAGNSSSYTYTDYGYLYSAIVVDPAMTDRVVSAIKGIAKDLHEGEVSQDELDRSLKPLLESLKQSTRNNGYWLNVVLASSQEYPQRLDFARSRDEDYASITVEDIDKLAKIYLSPQRGVELIVLP